MTDKELLEAAAKAAGNAPTGISYLALLRLGQWNPLEDNGDVLLLAVKVGINISINVSGGPVYAQWVDENDCLQEEPADGDLPSIRRAITRAAAEIGKSLPQSN